MSEVMRTCERCGADFPSRRYERWCSVECETAQVSESALSYADWSRTKWGVTSDMHISQLTASLLAGAVGLSGESGEILDRVKKLVFHGHAFDDAMRTKLVEEAGDAYYYLTQLLIDLGVTRSQLEERNRAKLNARYKAGFTPAESINRKG